MRRDGYPRRLIAGLVLVALVGAAMWSAGRIAADRAIAAERERLGGVATLAATNFRRQIETFELVATALSADPELPRVLDGRDAEAAVRLNDRLATLSDRLDTSVIYLMDRRGDTIVSSNYRQPDSFVGENYRFRAYYATAMEEGGASQFALGTRSRIPGLFLARRIDVAGRPAGVLVVKIRFDRLENEWARSIGEAFVTDADGIIIVTSDPKLRFSTIAPVSPDRRSELRAKQAFGDETLALHPAMAAGRMLYDTRWKGEAFLAVSVSAVGNRRLTVVEPAAPIAVPARNVAWLTIAALASIVLVGALVLSARRRAQAMRLEAARQAEAGELRNRFEMANRLSSLGQVAAGVGHEINQPLAAIGVRAGNAARLIETGRLDQARAALDEIGGLVARAGAITGELRQFARRSNRTTGPVLLAAVFSGLAMLMDDAVRQRGGKLEVGEFPDRLAVVAEQTRLEQVLVNLVQNALDAGGDATRVSIAVSASGNCVQILVRDDGPGIPPVIERSLFQPFTSTKVKGLGLGLVISRDIVSEFGGELSLIENSPRGAVFQIDLERAE